MELSYFSDKATFTATVDSIIDSVNKANVNYFARNGFKFSKPDVVRVVTIGKRFMKLSVFSDRSGVETESRVYVFIDLNTGAIHKAASYKAPETTGKTKGVRGNIFDANVLEKLTTFGTVYLTGGGCSQTIKWELDNPTSANV